MDNSTITRRKRTQRDYPLPFKFSVVQQIEQGEMTYSQAQSSYGIQGKSTVLVWLRRYGILDWSAPRDQLMTKPKETPTQTIKRLEKELKDERQHNLLLNKMVNIIDTEYGGNIRKKYLSKELDSFKPKAS